MHAKSCHNTFQLVDKLGTFELVNPNMMSNGLLKCPANIWEYQTFCLVSENLLFRSLYWSYEQEIIYCYLLDQDLKTSTRFVDIIPLKKTDVSHILGTNQDGIKNICDLKFVQQFLQEKEKQLKQFHNNFYEKLVSCDFNNVL